MIVFLYLISDLLPPQVPIMFLFTPSIQNYCLLFPSNFKIRLWFGIKLKIKSVA